MDIIAASFNMAEMVRRFYLKARIFYYGVILFGHNCPKCHGKLAMRKDSRCCCKKCGYEFDPTIQFQNCFKCGGRLELRVRRYRCLKCGSDVNSVFLFDGKVFDSRYFSDKMSESRQRKRFLKKQVQEMLAQSRSALAQLYTPDLQSIPGLVETLNKLTSGIEIPLPVELRGKFDLERYQRHICSVLSAGPKKLRQIPSIIENIKLDLIWRFIAVIFLDHSGAVSLRQQGYDIWVIKNAQRKGSAIPCGIEKADRIERPYGATQAG